MEVRLPGFPMLSNPKGLLDALCYELRHDGRKCVAEMLLVKQLMNRMDAGRLLTPRRLSSSDGVSKLKRARVAP